MPSSADCPLKACGGAAQTTRGKRSSDVSMFLFETAHCRITERPGCCGSCWFKYQLIARRTPLVEVRTCLPIAQARPGGQRRLPRLCSGSHAAGEVSSRRHALRRKSRNPFCSPRRRCRDVQPGRQRAGEDGLPSENQSSCSCVSSWPACSARFVRSFAARGMSFRSASRTTRAM